MATAFEDVIILQIAEQIADDIWKDVVSWDAFARGTVGGQLARASDSVGANIAEAFGRYHYGEKLQFLYYARGSIFETKYWLNRARTRNLMPREQAEQYTAIITDLARQLNAFVASIKHQRRDQPKSKSFGEPIPQYETESEYPGNIFSKEQLYWLESSNRPISNL